MGDVRDQAWGWGAVQEACRHPSPPSCKHTLPACHPPNFPCPCRRESAQLSGYAKQHQARKAAAAAREAREAELAAAWPHGCPAGVHKAARQQGLHPAAVQQF